MCQEVPLAITIGLTGVKFVSRFIIFGRFGILFIKLFSKE